MKCGFVLLHYNNINVTYEAVSYLQKITYKEQFEIVIVDNASPNGTGSELKKMYMDIEGIHVIICSKNVGFAKGNNTGYQYARNILHCDTIIVMNSDVMIKDQRFLSKLKNHIEACDANILAPDIIGRKGHQNPFRIDRLSDKRLKKLYCYNKTINTLYHVPLINLLLAFLLEKKNNNKKQKKAFECNCIQCIPHGACVIFLPSWVQKEIIAFPPLTFLYFEEDILAEYMWEKGYKAIYERNLIVYHLEDASIEYDQRKNVKKRRFISGYMCDSIKVLMEMRGKGRNNGAFK